MGHHRFLFGTAATGVGAALLAVGYLVDPTLLGPFTTLALVGAVLVVVGSLVAVVGVVRNPDSIDFEDSGPGRYGPTFALVSGLVIVAAGLMTLALAVVG